MEATNATNATNARQAARDAGRERAKLASVLAANAARRDAQKARHANELEGLKGKARAETARGLIQADKAATLATLDGAQVTLTLRLVRDADGQLTARAAVEDILVATDVTGAPVRVAVLGSLRITDSVRVSVDTLVQ